MNDYLLFVDTEASGLPLNWDLPYSATDNWPSAVQISWLIYTRDGQEVKREDHYVLNADFVITPKAMEIHGINPGILSVKGEERATVMQMLANDLNQYKPLVVGHFIELDYHILSADFYRAGLDNPLSNLPMFCTMLATTKLIWTPMPKSLLLGDLYAFLFYKPLQNQHNALSDAKAAADCYFELMQRGEINTKLVEKQQEQASIKNLKKKSGKMVAGIYSINNFDADRFISAAFMNERVQYLQSIVPFNQLPVDVLQGLAEQLQEVNYKKDTVIYQQESTKLKGVDIIVKGEYESFFYDSTQSKRLIEYHTEGFCFGGVSILLNRRQSMRTVIAKKGTLVYFLHRKDFRALCKAYEDFFLYFTAEFGKRMQNEEFVHFFKRPAAFEESYMAADQVYSRKIESVEYRPIVQCTENTSIYKAAASMAANKVSCLFVTDEQKQIKGYVTDITLRDKVIAQQRNAADPVGEVMDNPIVSIDIEAYVYEAILMMFSTKTRYLLVEKSGEYVGFLSRNKLLSEQAQSPLVFIQSVKSAMSDDELKRKWDSVPHFVNQLLERGVNAQIANQVISTIADTIAQKVIENVIESVGEPPAKFVFMVLGSEGRKEQTFKTDQDNAIIYEDKANEHREEVRAYFLEFAEQVSGRLNAIGIAYCTGGFMAQNPKWTHSLSHWKRNYLNWMAESLPETVINFSTFFDCRFVYGDAGIMDELHAFLNEELQKPMDKLFHNMAVNALQYEPPLTFFNTIRTFTKNKREVFDIKKAMTPIVDLVRVYALKHRVFEVNTGERMKALRQLEVFSETAYHELSQSYYFLMSMRLKKQATQIIYDKSAPDNYIDLSGLTKIERVTLKEIFKVIGNFQSKIKMDFTNSIL